MSSLPGSWIEVVQHVADGEPVAASATDRPTRQLEQNLRQLRDLIELSTTGQVTLIPEIAIDPTLSPGQPVWWNPTTAQCEAALASVVFDQVVQTLVGTPQSEVLGVLWKKSSSTTGTIILSGWLCLDITAALNGQPLVAGRYYLSGSTPGTVLQTQASLSVPVLFADGTGNVQINPQWRQWAQDHEHFKVSLVCAPAGDASRPAYGQRHYITNADAAIPGWLPANHPSFGGHAPPQAVFGYNIAADPELFKLWPPFPPDAAVLIWDRGVDNTGGTEVSEHLAILDRHGIWWHSNCYGEVPWPLGFTFDDGHAYDSMSESDSISTEIECPLLHEMWMTLYFSRTLYSASKTVVTSLRAAPNSVIEVYGCGGQPASTGDLTVNANLALLIDKTGQAGSQVLKTITNNKFEQGPVVEGLISASESLVINSTLSGVNGLKQGICTLSIATNPLDSELSPVLSRLSDSKERYENGIAYLGMPANFECSILQVFQVPAAGIVVGTTAIVRVTLLGTAVGTLPILTLTYRTVSRGTSTPAVLPAVDIPLILSTPPTLATNSTYIEAVTDAFAITGGDMVQIVITRNASDGYSGEVGLLRSSLVMIPPGGSP